MRLDAAFTRSELRDRNVNDGIIVVTDVLRATTVMITALAHGAKAIIPQDDDAAARALYADLNHQGVPALLCGEKEGFKRPGYDLGNSPLEYTLEAVRGKTLVHQTTNGTRALAASAPARRILIASFCNRSAVAQRLLEIAPTAEAKVLLVASGTEEKYSMEDTVCLGAILASMTRFSSRPIERTDAAQAALDLFQYYQNDLLGMIRRSVHGRYLQQIGLGDDLPACGALDTETGVPEMRLGRVALISSGSPV